MMSVMSGDLLGIVALGIEVIEILHKALSRAASQPARAWLHNLSQRHGLIWTPALEKGQRSKGGSSRRKLAYAGTSDVGWVFHQVLEIDRIIGIEG